MLRIFSVLPEMSESSVLSVVEGGADVSDVSDVSDVLTIPVQALLCGLSVADRALSD